MKNKARSTYGAAALGIGLLLAAAIPASAATLSQGQMDSVVSLLRSFGVDQATIVSVEATLGIATPPSPVQPTPIPAPSCPPPMTANLYQGTADGSAGGGVANLQTFLGVNPTGYFGPLTKAAVANWQSQNYIAPTGYVGPATRAAMAPYWCHKYPGPSETFSAVPTSGAAPLSVSFSASDLAASDYNIDFGDGSNSGPIGAQCVGLMGVVGGPSGIRCIISANHTYAAAGSYTATLYRAPDPRSATAVARRAIGSVTITATGSGENTGGISIGGLDAPAALTVGQTGTWTVHVSSTGNSSDLHYSVVWGDESQKYGAATATGGSPPSQSSATFTHSYAQAGVYTPIFTVSNDAGQSASVNATVSVSGAASGTFTIPGSVTLPAGQSATRQTQSPYETDTLTLNTVHYVDPASGQAGVSSADFSWQEYYCGSAQYCPGYYPVPQTFTLYLNGSGGTFTTARGHVITLSTIGSHSATVYISQ